MKRSRTDCSSEESCRLLLERPSAPGIGGAAVAMIGSASSHRDEGWQVQPLALEGDRTGIPRWTGCAARLQPGAVPRRRADHSAGLRAPAELLSAAPACVIANADLPADHGWSQASTAIETRDVVHGKPDPMHRFRNAAIERRRNSICGGRAPALGASIARKRELTSGILDAVMAQSDRSASMGGEAKNSCVESRSLERAGTLHVSAVSARISEAGSMDMSRLVTGSPANAGRGLGSKSRLTGG